MAKRADHDATMDVSASQLVPDAPGRPRVPDAQARGRAPRGAPQHDMSVWKQVVVGSDDFAPPPRARTGGRRWLIAGALGAAVVGSGAAVAMYKLDGDAPSPATAPAPAGEAAKPAAAVAPSPAPAPAEQAAAPARSTEAAPAELAAPAPTWLAELASILATEVAAMTWLDTFAGRVELAMAADAAAPKKPGKRTAAASKRGATTKKKPAPRR